MPPAATKVNKEYYDAIVAAENDARARAHLDQIQAATATPWSAVLQSSSTLSSSPSARIPSPYSARIITPPAPVIHRRPVPRPAIPLWPPGRAKHLPPPARIPVSYWCYRNNRVAWSWYQSSYCKYGNYFNPFTGSIDTALLKLGQREPWK